MLSIIDALNSADQFCAGGSASDSEIEMAEAELGLKFASEYKEYLRKYAFASYYGHELTGICKSPRLNVVKVTQEARDSYQFIDDEMYVVEDTGYEGILILQNAKGTIYQIEPNEKPSKIYSSLTAYVQK